MKWKAIAIGQTMVQLWFWAGIDYLVSAGSKGIQWWTLPFLATAGVCIIFGWLYCIHLEDEESKNKHNSD